jgi:protein phosphatase
MSTMAESAATPPSECGLSEAKTPLIWSGCTHPGRYRPNNEDAFLALTFDANEVRYLGKSGKGVLDDADYIFAVSDGMGGANSGEFASRIATQAITRQLPRSFRAGEPSIATALTNLYLAIHAEMLMHSRSYEECRGMGATLSLGWFMPGAMHFAHIGDSRIYHLPSGGELRQLTHDHSYAGWLYRQGKLNERELRTHPRRSLLMQALGAGNQFLQPQISSVPCGPGDRFLLCSDGVIDGIWDHALAKHLRSPRPAETLGEHFVQTAIEEGSRDNVTAMVITL